MTKDTQKLSKGATEKDLKNLIKLSHNEIREWKDFILTCKKKIREMDKKTN